MVDFPRSLALLVGSLALAGTAASQQLHHVWVVNAPSQLQPAVDAAAEGDTVLVKASGNYDLLVQAKSLTVVADPPADVRILGAEVKDLTASQRVELRGLKFVPRYTTACFASFTPSPGLKLLNNAGLVWVEDCNALGFGSLPQSCRTVPGILVDRCADVVLLRTRSEGMTAAWDHVDDHVNDGHALVVRGSSRVVAHGCTFRGATGYPPDQGGSVIYSVDGAAGLRSESTGDRVYLSDCQATGGDGICGEEEGIASASDGGAGIAMAGVAWVLDSQLTGGSGGEGWECWPDGGDGPAFTGNVQSIPGPALRFSITAPVREGQSYQLDFLGPPSTPMWFLFSPEPSGRFRLRGTLLADSPNVSFAGITDATGALQVTRSMPNMPPSLELGRLYAQAFYLGPRGEIVLGGGSLFLALDQSF